MAAHEQAEQIATKKRAQARRHPGQAAAARRAGDGEIGDPVAVPSRPAPSLIDKQGGAIDNRKPNGTGERSGRAAMTSSR